MTPAPDERPVGTPLPDWRRPPAPEALTLVGRTVTLEPLEHRHAPALHAAWARHDELWTYLPWGPFEAPDAIESLVDGLTAQADWRPHAVVVDGTAHGMISYLRIQPAAGSIEIGGITYGPAIQRSAVTTEATFLLAERAFALGYRRLEWKCDSLNAASRRAATRFGFTEEGTHRQATVVRGRNRDTTWFSILDHEWPHRRAEFERWLDPANHIDGRQRTRLRMWSSDDVDPAGGADCGGGHR